MLIKGFSFQGYRSVSSAKPAVLFPLRRVNLIAGQNNAGKSNILRVIDATYRVEKGKRAVSRWDRPLADAEHAFVRLELHGIDQVMTWDGIASQGADRLE